MTEPGPKILRVDSLSFPTIDRDFIGEHYGFFICKSGAMELRLASGVSKAGRGDIVVFRPKSKLEVIAVSDDIEGVLCVADSPFVQSTLTNLSLTEHLVFISNNPVLRPDAADLAAITSLTKLAWDRLESGERPLSERYVDSIARATVYMVLTVYYEIIARTPVARTRRDELLIEFENDLKKYAATRRDVTFYADRLHISPHYLSSIVRSLTGRSAKARIAEAVVSEACAMLDGTVFSVKEIAYKLGFPSQTFFGRYFRRVTGKSPSDYRNKR